MNLKLLSLYDGTKVLVPDSINLLTPYVIQEQLDWFEDEIKFIRELIQPGQNVIDIGANYGLYTLAFAKKVGQSGIVYAYEPSSATASILSESVKANGFSQIIIEKKALSNEDGEANLSINENSELNSLVNRSGLNDLSEKVTVTTLDNCMTSFGWENIDFVKIDAEGAEEKYYQWRPSFLRF
jgi:FkbM family methyltransferase